MNALSLKGMKYSVLDHGYVRLVDYMGGDIDISRAARVSFNHPARDEDAKLILRLWRDQHTSPFEAVEFQFEIKCPIFVARQWHRHRTWSYNEVSARYTELPSEYYLPSMETIGEQSKINKQGRERSFMERADDIDQYHDACAAAFKLYRELLDNRWPRELARMVLPLSTYTRFFAKTNLRNLLHFLTLRCDPHAQFEIRVYAEALRDLARVVAPLAINAWEQSAQFASNIGDASK